MRRLLALAATLLAFGTDSLPAQSLSQRFSRLFTFGDCGEPLCLSVDVVGPHGRHYIPSVTQGENDLLAFVTGSIATSLTNLPFTAATGGIAFRIVDGTLEATSVSAGSIFGERAQTLGRGQLLIGANVNGLSMDNIRGVPMRDLTFRFAHEDVGVGRLGDPLFENDIIEVHTRLGLDLLVASVFASYGVHNNIDIGVLIPVVRASLDGYSEAHVIPFERPTVHLFGTPGNTSEFAESTSSGSAIGIGDIAVRVKANLFQTDAVGAAIAGDVRLPTGDSANFLGSGQTSVRALGIISGSRGSFSPHLNAGVAVRTGSTQNNSVIGALGFDHLMTEGVTLAVDLLGDFALGESQLRLPEAVVLDEPSRRRMSLTDIPDQRDDLIDASIGLKVELPAGYRVVTNLLTPLSDGGLRPRYVWTTGVERSF